MLNIEILAKIEGKESNFFENYLMSYKVWIEVKILMLRVPLSAFYENDPQRRKAGRFIILERIPL
jgi:hypothetical protein